MVGTLYGPLIGGLGTEGIIATALGRSIAPFTATADSYDSVRLTWTAPVNTAGTGFQIVRSRSGFPRSVNDGVQVTIVETPTWNETNGYSALDLPGGWHYFSFFIKRTGNWLRVSTVDVLVPYDYGSAEKMWGTIPAYYRVISDDTASPSRSNLRINPALFEGEDQYPPNLLLWNFMTVFGWGVDTLRTQAEGVLTGYDVNTMHISRLATVARQFGHELEQAVPAHANRTMVRNLATLYRKRGTIAGIHDLVTMTTGWEVDVAIGPNLMLSEEQANLVNPDIPVWNETTQYKVTSPGNYVKHGNYVFRALTTSRGLVQAPPATATSNTWWEYQGYPRGILPPRGVGVGTGDVSTWQVVLDNVPVPGNTRVAVGSSDPLNTSDLTNNALLTHSSTGAVTNMEVLSVPLQDLGQPLITPTPLAYALENAVALPNVADWASGVTYQRGDQVIYLHARYQALTETQALPTDTVAWERIGDDDRPRLVVSTYAHGPFTGTNGTGGKSITPLIMEYDQGGNLLRKVRGITAFHQDLFFDPMVRDNVALIQGLAAPKGTWASDGVGTWTINRDTAGGRVTPPTSGKSQRWGQTSTSVGRVAVTWTADPGTSRLMGIVFKRSDTNNYWIATQTGLFKRVAGAALANPASGAVSWAKFTTGDRMTVQVEASVITVFKNGVQVGTATDAFNTAAVLHGLGTEA